MHAQAAANHPSERQGAPTPLHMKDTSVEFVFMQQDDVFSDWWAQVTGGRSVGLVQRFLYAFGGDMDPPAAKHGGFWKQVALPIFRSLFLNVVRTIGPRVTGQGVASFICTAEQNEVFAKLERIATLHKRRRDIPKVLRSAMPKTLFWLGTGSGEPVAGCSSRSRSVA